MKKNDCYQCPHRTEVPGSAHSQCNILKNINISFLIAQKVSSGDILGFNDDINGEGKTMIEFDPHGVRNGWCMWPINFDPVWVECFFPIKNNDK
jgi:hypothetical protein